MRLFSPLLHPLRVTLLALTWEGSPVVSQCSYGGVMRHYLHPVMQSLEGFFWLGSESHLMRC